MWLFWQRWFESELTRVFYVKSVLPNKCSCVTTPCLVLFILCPFYLFRLWHITCCFINHGLIFLPMFPKCCFLISQCTEESIRRWNNIANRGRQLQPKGILPLLFSGLYEAWIIGALSGLCSKSHTFIFFPLYLSTYHSCIQKVHTVTWTYLPLRRQGFSLEKSIHAHFSVTALNWQNKLPMTETYV